MKLKLVIQLGQICQIKIPRKPASSAEERWLSISIASLLYSDQGCDDMMRYCHGFGWFWVVEWSGVIFCNLWIWCLCKSFVGKLILQKISDNPWIWLTWPLKKEFPNAKPAVYDWLGNKQHPQGNDQLLPPNCLLLSVTWNFFPSIPHMNLLWLACINWELGNFWARFME